MIDMFCQLAFAVKQCHVEHINMWKAHVHIRRLGLKSSGFGFLIPWITAWAMGLLFKGSENFQSPKRCWNSHINFTCINYFIDRIFSSSLLNWNPWHLLDAKCNEPARGLSHQILLTSDSSWQLLLGSNYQLDHHWCELIYMGKHALPYAFHHYKYCLAHSETKHPIFIHNGPNARVFRNKTVTLT